MGTAEQAAWDAAMATYVAAKSEYETSWAAFKAVPAGQERDGQRMDDVALAFTNSEDDLLAIPAPNLTALRWKLEYVLRDDGDGEIAPYSVPYVAPILADIARLEAGTLPEEKTT